MFFACESEHHELHKKRKRTQDRLRVTVGDSERREGEGREARGRLRGQWTRMPKVCGKAGPASYHFTGTLKATRATGVYGRVPGTTSLKKRVANARRSTPPYDLQPAGGLPRGREMVVTPLGPE